MYFVELFRLQGLKANYRRVFMSVTTKIYKGVLLVKVSGEFDMHIAASFKEKIDGCLMQAGLKDIVIDMNEVFFIDSSGIGVLIGRYKKVMHLGGKMIISGMQEPVRKILTLSGVLKIIDSCGNENEALALLA